MNWIGKKVVVTGAAGFIGSHLVEKLVDLGASVSCFIRYTSKNDLGNLKSLPKAKLNQLKIYRGDLKDGAALESALKNSEIAFHLGAMVSIPYSYENPQEAITSNIIGTMNVLNASRRVDIEKFVHTSTSEVYGTAQYVPIDENHPLVSQSPYSASKVGADMIAMSYYYSYDFPVSIIRPFNTYGPGQSARAVIPTIIMQAILSDVVKLGDVNTTRDFTYVEDTVNGFLKIAESAKSVGQVINVGAGNEISISNVVMLVERILNKKLQIKIEEERIRPSKSEVRRLVSDSSKAKKLLGWKPEYTFESGLGKTIEWFAKNSNYFETMKYEI
ncbi:MAG: GDP-mannose 4,6-dehydratase [Actinobacteria bacterium]|nr:GDP-mannose 4,6-dehydratase [Actinomycetota bacterium]